eukprot:CAMPEP_0114254550 /NCGR_PEP_ID=MMETSP0058-20121206/17043_1 /TAXON_ID=36894 /ORGANISM="Pyramimonas parkeae, CCMP726" /LENGTH=77 /DNA_ID=CAMNT_0001368785 /DNA_START=86 /DNA_END=319 /DNA_ORIENTATION=+
MSGILRTAGARLMQRPTLLRQPVQGARTFAADPHGPPKVNAWEAPTKIETWKEEHIVFAVLGGWAAAIFTATKVFGK